MRGGLLIALIAIVSQATPPRDPSAARSAASAVIRGRIMSATSNQPLHRVRVTLNSQTPNLPSAVTDARREYEITGIPAGSYTLAAARSASSFPKASGRIRSFSQVSWRALRGWTSATENPAESP
jgi:hypothetical protein